MSRPETTIGVVSAPEPVPSVPPSLETQSASYWVIALPFSAGASKVTVMLPSSGRTLGWAGASGAIAAMTTASESSDAGDVPSPLVAVRLHV